jgi:hypothetical protein
LDCQQTYSYIISGVTLKFKEFYQEESACRCCDDLVTSVGNGPALWLTLSEGMSCCIGQSARKEQVADQMRCFFSYRDSLIRYDPTGRCGDIGNWCVVPSLFAGFMMLIQLRLQTRTSLPNGIGSPQSGKRISPLRKTLGGKRSPHQKTDLRSVGPKRCVKSGPGSNPGSCFVVIGRRGPNCPPPPPLQRVLEWLGRGTALYLYATF